MWSAESLCEEVARAGGLHREDNALLIQGEAFLFEEVLLAGRKQLLVDGCCISDPDDSSVTTRILSFLLIRIASTSHERRLNDRKSNLALRAERLSKLARAADFVSVDVWNGRLSTKSAYMLPQKLATFILAVAALKRCTSEAVIRTAVAALRGEDVLGMLVDAVKDDPSSSTELLEGVSTYFG